jgi:histone H3/H4
MTEYDMSIAPMHRIIKRAGAERVSEEASLALRDALEEIGVRIAREALDFTKHAGRKTVKAEDIQIAVTKVVRA